MKTSQRHLEFSFSKIDHPYMKQHMPKIKIGSLSNCVELKSIDGCRKKISDKHSKQRLSENNIFEDLKIRVTENTHIIALTIENENGLLKPVIQ